MSDDPTCPMCGTDRSDTICYEYNEHENLAGSLFADLCCNCFDLMTEELDDDEG